MKMSILNMLDAVAQVSSTNKKKELLKGYTTDSEFSKVCLYALDPFTTYGISNINLPLPDDFDSDFDVDPGSTWVEGFHLLDSLAARRLTGHKARFAIQLWMTKSGIEDSIVFQRILKGDLRMGAGTTILNKLHPGFIPSFDVMLAQKWNIRKLTLPAMVQPKFDGLRCVVIVRDESVKFLSRGGKEFDTLEFLVPELLRVIPKGIREKGIMLDSEVISLRGDFQKTCSDVKRSDAVTTEIALMIFDAMNLDQFEKESNDNQQILRTAAVDAIFKSGKEKSDHLIAASYVIVNTEEEIHAWYDKYREDGYEGAIVKNLREGYQFKRSWNWMKLKPSKTEDLSITGFYEGEGKYVGMLGGFFVDYNGKNCSVGGGYSDIQRVEFWNNRYEMIGDLIEVKFMEETADGAMRHPNFIAVRSFKGEKV